MTVVVDTNVPVVANGHSEQASPDCVVACARRLEALTRSGKLALDDKWLIIGEYRANLRSSGQPGVGDAFLKWVLTNWGNSQRCEIVKITLVNSSETEFREFPKDKRLRAFDPSDRKFVAVALAHPNRPPILQAVDWKWWGFRKVLHSNGVDVEFLCEEDYQGDAKSESRLC